MTTTHTSKHTRTTLPALRMSATDSTAPTHIPHYLRLDDAEHERNTTGNGVVYRIGTACSPRRTRTTRARPARARRRLDDMALWKTTQDPSDLAQPLHGIVLALVESSKQAIASHLRTRLHHEG